MARQYPGVDNWGSRVIESEGETKPGIVPNAMAMEGKA